MEKKEYTFGRSAILGIYLGVLCLQTVCALAWGALNITDYKRIEETMWFYEKFPNCPPAVYAMLYLMHIAVCGTLLYLSFAAFMRATGKDKVRSVRPFLWTMLILTNPYVWETMFTLLPDVLTASVCVFVLSHVALWYGKLRKEEGKSGAMVVLLFFLLILSIAVSGFVIIRFIRSGGQFSLGVKELVKEWFSTVFSPFILALPEYPLGDTMNPFWLNVFWQKAPVLSLFYLRTASIGYALCIVFGAVKGAVVFFRETAENRKDKGRLMLFWGLAIVVFSLAFTVLANSEFDYRNALVSYLLWGIGAAGLQTEMKKN